MLIKLLTTLGANISPPRQSRLETLCEDMRQPAGEAPWSRAKTLGGCRIVPDGADFLICREAGRCEVLTAPQGASLMWDKRFLVRLPDGAAQSAGLYTIRSLGETGWAAIRRKISDSSADYLPRLVRLALPAIHKRGKIVAVPHLNFYNVGSFGHPDVRFMPLKSATSAGFPVV
ncbi:MAG: hypothetical protein O3B21_16935 [Proteobacteria bacterium]|nr:hypothetical protein [Pseudomonadota bacterium]